MRQQFLLSTTTCILIIILSSTACKGRPLEDVAASNDQIIFPGDNFDFNSRLHIQKVATTRRPFTTTTTTDKSEDGGSWIIEDDDGEDNNLRTSLSSREQLLLVDDDDLGFRRNSNRKSQLQALKSFDPCEIGMRHRFSSKGGGKMNKCGPINVKG